jgi:hypothetical protein
MLQASSTREIRETAREIKFVVPPAVAADILQWVRPRLAPDPYAGGPDGDEYQTTTLYLDTDTLAVYHRRGSYRRSKYRIRRYGSADVVFLERKLRTSRMLTKRRTTVPIEDLALLSAGRLVDGWAGRWFSKRLEARELRPVCQVTYHRHARVGTGPFGPLRLTVDHHIVAQPAEAFAFVPVAGTTALPGRCIVEMKYRGEMPSVLRCIVEQFALEPTAVSKYRAAIVALAAERTRVGPDGVDLAEAVRAPVPADVPTGPVDA